MKKQQLETAMLITLIFLVIGLCALPFNLVWITINIKDLFLNNIQINYISIIVTILNVYVCVIIYTALYELSSLYYIENPFG